MNKKKLIVSLAVVAIVAAGFYYYQTKPDVSDPLVAYKAAMGKDTVGGKTPAETLALFVAALKANDATGAAQYFMLDDNVSRAKWEKQLADLQAQGMLIQMADDIEKNAQATNPTYEGDAGYELLDDSGMVRKFLDMELNKFSGVWKLQSL